MAAAFFLIVSVAIVVGAFCKSRDINPALPLIAAGFMLAWIIPGNVTEFFDPELVLTLMLAPLVFAAGLASSAVDLRGVRRSVLLLAVVLVVLTTAIIGGVTSLFIPALPIAAALALGAALAPTDAVAASTVAKKSGLPRDVTLVIEGESLANDGTALTILRVALVAVAVGSVTLVQASGILLLAVLGGVAVGAAGGWLVSWLMKVAVEPVVANAILLFAPFVLYEISEKIGGSGLLTVVIAGVWIAHATGAGPAYQARLQAASVWSLITFGLESLAFVIVGVAFLDTESLIQEPAKWQIVLFSIALTVALLVTRGIFMAGWFLTGPKLTREVFADPRRKAKEFVAIALLGVRGPVSVLAVLSFPLDFPKRDLILTVTFAVVTLSLCSSFLASPIITRLHLNKETEEEALLVTRIAVGRAALKRLDEIVLDAESNGDPIPDKIARRLRSVAVRRVDSLQAAPERAVLAGDLLRIQRRLQRSMLHAERRELHRLASERSTPGDIVQKLTYELDVREAALGQHGKM